jgi:hypothetical protein
MILEISLKHMAMRSGFQAILAIPALKGFTVFVKMNTKRRMELTGSTACDNVDALEQRSPSRPEPERTADTLVWGITTERSQPNSRCDFLNLSETKCRRNWVMVNYLEAENLLDQDRLIERWL